MAVCETTTAQTEKPTIQGEEWRTPPKNQLVLIGRNLNAEQLRQQLVDCLA